MSQAIETRVNPYESPRCVDLEGSPVSEQMHRLRQEYEHRFEQLGLDAIMAAEFSAAFGMIAWRLSEEPVYASVSAAAPIIFFAVESTRDFIRVVQEFPGRMNALRERASREWDGLPE